MVIQAFAALAAECPIQLAASATSSTTATACPFLRLASVCER